MKKRILLLYAHPDDEILSPGGTITHLAQEGAHIELVCATRGEAGEIADPSLATPETLGQVREQELYCSAAALGIKKVHFLGYRDSGMAGTAANENPAAFINAPAEAVVPQLVKIIRALRPQIIFTFEPYGGYGHPDHIAINRHGLAAFDAAADVGYQPQLGASWQTSRLFYPFLPSFLFLAVKQAMVARGMDISFFDGFSERRKNGWPDDRIDYTVDVQESVAAKWAAFQCHRTQFGENSFFRRLPVEVLSEIFGKEYFALARPLPPPEQQFATLFDGL